MADHKDHAAQINLHELAQSLSSVQQEFQGAKDHESHNKGEEELGDPSTFKTYDGHCHCGNFRFQITIPKLEKLNECNCSICFVNGLRGLVWFPLGGKRKFEIVEGDEEKNLTSYSFGSGRLQHKVYFHLTITSRSAKITIVLQRMRHQPLRP